MGQCVCLSLILKEMQCLARQKNEIKKSLITTQKLCPKVYPIVRLYFFTEMHSDIILF